MKKYVILNVLSNLRPRRTGRRKKERSLMRKTSKKMETKLAAVYEYVKNYIEEKKYPPSMREICAALDIKSTASAYVYLNKLEERGLLSKAESKKRAINLTEEELPFLKVPVIGQVTAGTPIFAYENYEEFLPVPTEYGTEDELFMLKVKGSSMIGAGILNGDKIIVKKQDTADNGQIVVAYFDESATVKRFFRKGAHVVLHPENPTMTDIILKNVTILGVVVGLMRKF